MDLFFNLFIFLYYFIIGNLVTRNFIWFLFCKNKVFTYLSHRLRNNIDFSLWSFFKFEQPFHSFIFRTIKLTYSTLKSKSLQEPSSILNFSISSWFIFICKIIDECLSIFVEFISLEWIILIRNNLSFSN